MRESYPECGSEVNIGLRKLCFQDGYRKNKMHTSCCSTSNLNWDISDHRWSAWTTSKSCAWWWWCQSSCSRWWKSWVGSSRCTMLNATAVSMFLSTGHMLLVSIWKRKYGILDRACISYKSACHAFYQFPCRARSYPSCPTFLKLHCLSDRAMLIQQTNPGKP